MVWKSSYWPIPGMSSESPETKVNTTLISVSRYELRHYCTLYASTNGLIEGSMRAIIGIQYRKISNEPKCSSPSIKESITAYIETYIQPAHIPVNYFLQVHFNIEFSINIWEQNLTKICSYVFVSSICAICPAFLIQSSCLNFIFHLFYKIIYKNKALWSHILLMARIVQQ